MKSDIVRPVTLLVLPYREQISFIHEFLFPALRNARSFADYGKDEPALELYINDEYYGTLYKDENGSYPDLLLSVSDRPTTFRMKAVRSGTHYRPITIPYGTEECAVIFCEKYPDNPAAGYYRPQVDSIDLTAYDTTALLIGAIADILQPKGEAYTALAKGEAHHIRIEFRDAEVYFHFITDPRNPEGFPSAKFHVISYLAVSENAEQAFGLLNAGDCQRLQRIMEEYLPRREDLQHLQFFTEDGHLCVMSK